MHLDRRLHVLLGFIPGLARGNAYCHWAKLRYFVELCPMTMLVVSGSKKPILLESRKVRTVCGISRLGLLEHDEELIHLFSDIANLH